MKKKTKEQEANERHYDKFHNNLNKMMAQKFLKESTMREKTIAILLPLVKQEEVEKLIAELYDLRKVEKEKFFTTDDLIEKIKEKAMDKPKSKNK